MAIFAIASSCGNLCLKYGLSEVHLPVVNSLITLLQAAALVLTNFWVLLGIVLLIIQFIAFVQALLLGPLSLVVPLRASTYILTTVGARYILNNQISGLRWLAILVILAGVCMVGFGSQLNK